MADLWEGRTEALAATWPSGHDAYDRSAADGALAAHLAFWTGKDCARIERLLRRSALVREKWDRRGDNYLHRTILGAVARCERVYVDAPEDLSAPTGYGEFWAYLPGHTYVYRATRQLWPAAAVDGALPWPSNSEGKRFRPSAWLDAHRPIHCMTWHPAYPETIGGKVVTNGGWIEHAASTTFNLYLPPAIIPGDHTAAGRWLDHAHRIYPGEADHIAAWLAHRLQNPGEKINHALVLGGEQGIGKDTLLEPVKLGVGPWNFQEIVPTQLLGRFNPWVRAVILRISEAHDLGDMDRFAFYEHTKPLFAAPPDTILCDEKHTREHYVFNVLGAIITTNYLTGGLYLPPGDRRHFVAWSEASKEDFGEQYWSELWCWLHEGGIGHVIALLRNWNLFRFDPKAPPPKTEAWQQIVAAGIAPEDADLADLIAAMGDPAILTFDTLRAAAVQQGMANIIADMNDQRRQKAMVHRLDRPGYGLVRNPDEQSGRWSYAGRKFRVYGRKDMTTRELIAAAGLAALAGFSIAPTTAPSQNNNYH